jgi:hypothetical protein
MVDSAQQRLIVLVGADDWAQANCAAEAYDRVLAQRPDLLQSTDLMTDHRDWLALFQPHRLNLLTPQAETDLRNQSKQYWVDIALAKLYSPFAGFQPGAWRDDPFGLFEVVGFKPAQETRSARATAGCSSATASANTSLCCSLRVPAFSMAAQQAVIPC